MKYNLIQGQLLSISFPSLRKLLPWVATAKPADHEIGSTLSGFAGWIGFSDVRCVFLFNLGCDGKSVGFRSRCFCQFSLTLSIWISSIVFKQLFFNNHALIQITFFVQIDYKHDVSVVKKKMKVAVTQMTKKLQQIYNTICVCVWKCFASVSVAHLKVVSMQTQLKSVRFTFYFQNQRVDKHKGISA